MKDVGYVPNREVSLFSITKEKDSNWILSGNRNKIKITYQGVSLELKEKIKTSIGHVFGTYFSHMKDIDNEFNCLVISSEKSKKLI